MHGLTSLDDYLSIILTRINFLGNIFLSSLRSVYILLAIMSIAAK